MIKMSEKLANPAPLGLLGFGLTTILLNLHNAGFFPLNSMILAMGLAYGGMAQIIAGAMEYRKGNTFGTTAFTSYGLFWLSLVGLIVIPEVFGGISGPTETAMAAYFCVWGMFTTGMFFGTLKTNRALQFVFGSLALLLFMLTASTLSGNASLGTATGYEGIVCGLSAAYLAIAEVLNEAHSKTIIPIGTVSIKK
jgi:hypothetical protein